MAERIRQVTISYVTHRYFLWATLAALVVIIVPNAVAVYAQRTHDKAATPAVMLLAIPLMFALPYLCVHVRSQFGNWRSRLTPNFTTPHLIVLIAILLLLLVAYPLAIAICGQLSPTGSVALVVTFAVPVIWGTEKRRMLGMVVALAIYFSVLTDVGLHWWILDSAQPRPAHLAIIALGVALIVAWLLRIAHLNEEMSNYATAPACQTTAPYCGETRATSRTSADQSFRSPLIAWINDTWLAGLSNRSGGTITSPQQLSRLLQFGFSPWPVEIQALFITLAVGCVSVFMTDCTSWGRKDASALNFFLFFATIMPGFAGGEWLAQRRPRVAAEIVRPFTRRQLVEGLFLAVVRNMIAYWCIINLGFLVVSWHVLGDQLNGRTIVTFAFLSMAISFATLGLTLRVSVFRSQFARICIAMLAWTLMAHIASWWFYREKFGDFPFAAVAVIVAGVGGYLFDSARRAWLDLELG